MTMPTPASPSKSVVESYLDVTVYVGSHPINVLAFYRAKGFSRLPATPTMTGADLKSATPHYSPMYQLELLRDGRGVPVGDMEALALTDGMKFIAVPPATY